MTQKPILYYARVSPPVRAVLLAAKEIGVDLDLRPIDLFKDEHLTPEFLKMNPQHTIPTLDDNGTIVYDSHAINGYLVDKYAKDDKLFPKDLAKRAQVQARLHFNSGFLFARLRSLFEPVLFFGSTDCSVDKIAYIQRTYDIMESFLKDHDYICGDHLTIADFACISSITSVCEAAPIDSTKYPKVLAWIHRLEQLPYYQELNQEGADECKKLFRETLAANRAK